MTKKAISGFNFTHPMPTIMKSLAMALFACVLFGAVSSCRKEGVNQNLDPNAQKTYDFMSVKSGSYWKYGSRSGIAYTRYARSRDSIKNGLTYSYFERTDSIGNVLPEYFGKNNQYYITLIDMDGGQTTYLPYVFWKDSATKGTTWDNTGKVYYALTGDVDVLIESSQAEDGLTMVIGSKTYNNVVHVHSDLKVTLLNTKVGTVDIWFVKGLGMLREEFNVDIFGAYKQSHTDSLLDYHIEE